VQHLNQHILICLVRHHDYQVDIGDHSAAAALAQAASWIDVSAELPDRPYRWLSLRIQTLQETYKGYNISEAAVASKTLSMWVDYAVQPQHRDYNDYASRLKASAETASTDLWHALKNGVLGAPPPYGETTKTIDFSVLQQQWIEQRMNETAQIRLRNPHLFPRIPAVPSKPALRPEAKPFKPPPAEIGVVGTLRGPLTIQVMSIHSPGLIAANYMRFKELFAKGMDYDSKANYIRRVSPH